LISRRRQLSHVTVISPLPMSFLLGCRAYPATDQSVGQSYGLEDHGLLTLAEQIVRPAVCKAGTLL
jgi:hypothetical protein